MAAAFADFRSVATRSRGPIGRSWDTPWLCSRQFLQERQLRGDAAELRARDERMLRDIGIERDELEPAVRTGRRQSDHDAARRRPAHAEL